MATRLVTVTYVVKDEDYPELAEWTSEALERWLYDSTLDLNSEAAAPDARLCHPEHVAVLELD